MVEPDFKKTTLAAIRQALQWGEPVSLPNSYYELGKGRVKTKNYSDVAYDYLEDYGYEYIFKRSGEKDGTTEYVYGNGDNILIFTYDDKDKNGDYILSIGSDDADLYRYF